MLGVPGITVLAPPDAVRAMLPFWAPAVCSQTTRRHGMER